MFTDLNLLRTLIVLGLLLDRSDRLVMPDRLQTPRTVRPPVHTGQTGLFRLLLILVINSHARRNRASITCCSQLSFLLISYHLVEVQ